MGSTDCWRDAVGFVTLFFGLVIMFPLIGHATWHAFRDLVERDDDKS